MGNKDRPGKPEKKTKEQDTDEQQAEKRAKRKQQKHDLKVLKRKARRRGLLPPVTPQVVVPSKTPVKPQ